MARLNAITWPAIRDLVAVRIRDLATSARAAIVLENALLYETGSDAHCDAVWCVTVSEGVAIDRVAQRDAGLPVEEARRRVESQREAGSIAKTKAQLIICNDADQAELEKQIHAAWKDLAVGK
jgi:dephospho-CoA kinase